MKNEKNFSGYAYSTVYSVRCWLAFRWRVLVFRPKFRVAQKLFFRVEMEVRASTVCGGRDSVKNAVLDASVAVDFEKL